MNPLIILTCVFAAAFAAPAPEASNYGIAPAPVDQYVGSVSHVAGEPITTIQQQPAIVSKQVHLGKTQFVSGYSTGILKPPTPDFNIAVPTVLKGSVTHNAPLVKNIKETHVVNEPVAVPRRVDVPYDVPVPREVIEEVAVPVHVDRPYAVHHPVAVQGEPIVNVRRNQPIVQRTHTALAAAPAIANIGYAAAPLGLGYANAGYATGHAYAAAAPAYAAAAPAVALAGEY